MLEILKERQSENPVHETGLKTKAGHEVVEYDILFEEVELDEGDKRVFFMCIWIKELAAFQLLDTGALFNYLTMPFTDFLEAEYQELSLENMLGLERMHFLGSAFDGNNYSKYFD